MYPSAAARKSLRHWSFREPPDSEGPCYGRDFAIEDPGRPALLSVESFSVATGDIYVQVTATAEGSHRAKSIVVLVPGKSIEDCRTPGKRRDDRAIAQHLADPLAMYLFTHRASFGRFKVARSFLPTPPPEIEGEFPEFTRGDLKAWVL